MPARQAYERLNALEQVLRVRTPSFTTSPASSGFLHLSTPTEFPSPYKIIWPSIFKYAFQRHKDRQISPICQLPPQMLTTAGAEARKTER